MLHYPYGKLRHKKCVYMRQSSNRLGNEIIKSSEVSLLGNLSKTEASMCGCIIHESIKRQTENFYHFFGIHKKFQKAVGLTL